MVAECAGRTGARNDIYLAAETDVIAKTLLTASTPLAMALAAGAFVATQAAVNSSLARFLGHPLWAAVVSLLVSTAVALAAVAVMKLPLPSIRGLSNGPWWLWVGGIAGVVYLGCAVSLPAKIGTSAFILWVMAGQMAASIVIDHFGLLGMEADR